MASTSRILIAELDSPAQRRRFRDAGQARAVTELTGMLRIGMLVSNSIIVTDAMLLDGEYFMSLGPEGVLRELGATPARYPIIVTSRDPSVREGLERRLADPSFDWSLSDMKDRRPSAATRAQWEQWLRAIDEGIVRCEPPQTTDAPLRVGVPPVASPEELAVLAASGIGDEPRRSVAWPAIAGLDVSEETRGRVRAWWNSAYLRMIAENAQADWASFEAETGEEALSGQGSDALPVSSQLMDWARDCTPATIAVAWDATGKQRTDLHERPTTSRMRNLAFAVTQVTSPSSRVGVLAGSIMKLLIALVVVALAAPGLEIGGIDSPWTWIAFVGVIATTVPFDALLRLRELLRRDPLARIVIHRAGEVR